jgi:hypothetical protein
MFALDDDELIYLHDTNEKQCSIAASVQPWLHPHPVGAHWQLGRWGVSRRKPSIPWSRVGRPTPCRCLRDIRVALVYSTRFPDEHGEIVSNLDVYSHQTAQAG